MSIYFYGCMTLDGYLADRKHNLNWLYETGTTEETDYENFYNNMDITIMGKRTYDEISKSGDVKSVYPATKNYVFTHSQEIQSGVVPVNCDVLEFVKQIDPDKNIWIVGGNTILSPLLDGDMVDSLIIQIAPVLLGAGIPLFTQKEALKRFSLKTVRQYGQFAELVYSK